MTVTIVLAMPISRLRASSTVPWKTNAASADTSTLANAFPSASAISTAAVGITQSAPRRYSHGRLAPHDT